MSSGITAGFLLDRQYYWLRGEMEKTKKPTLLTLARVLAETKTPYAIIGGVALQAHHPDPRTTLDIDVAVLSRDAIPREALTGAGFRKTGSYEHSENWAAADGTPVQFTDDPALARAIDAADQVMLDDVGLRVIGVVDLLREKIRSAGDPQRRKSKHFHDLGDIQALLEMKPGLQSELHAEERAALEALLK